MTTQLHAAARGRNHQGDDMSVYESMTPQERSLRAQIAAHESWARTADRSARTAPARKALLDKFERQVDPEGNLPPAERALRAENARKAYFRRLALKSAQARRRRQK